jgi:hypothetical protein cdivTM7_00309
MAIDKRKTKFRIKRLSQIKTWQLVILLVMSSFISATFLRLNNVGMVERRESVENADKTGDIVSLQQRLYDLQRYVSTHMNTHPGKIALDHTYKRAYEQKLKEFEEAIKNRSNNDTVSKVRSVCDAKAQQGGYGRFTTQADPRYINCINEEWEKYPAAKVANLQFEAPSTEPYYHTFVSPVWSADFAGWSLLVTILIAVIIIVRLVILGVLKLMLKRRNKLF